MNNNVLLLVGPENGKKSQFIDEVRENINKKASGSWEEYKYYAFQDKIADIVSIMQTGSLFARHRLIQISHVEEIKNKTDIDIIVKYIKNPLPDVTLILISDTIKIDQKIESAVTAKNKTIFWELFKNQKYGWIKNYCNQNNFKISDDAIDILLQLVENDTGKIQQECNKLFLFLGPETTITTDHIENYLYHSKEENIFSLFEKMVATDLVQTLGALENIFLSTNFNPVQLLAVLQWQLNQLYTVKKMIVAHYSKEEIIKTVNIKGKKNQALYLKTADKYSLEDIENMLKTTVLYDEYIRSHKSELHPLLLQTYFYLCVKKKGKPLSKPLFSLTQAPSLSISGIG